MSVPARQPRRLWRLAAAGIICLLIGTAVNVLVAWGTAAGLHAEWLISRRKEMDPPSRSSWPFPAPKNVNSDRFVISQSHGLWKDEISLWRKREFPSGVMGQPLSKQGGGQAVLFGLPFRSLGMYSLFTEDISPHSVARVALPGGFRAELPTHVLWPGFAANTLIYAALAYGLSWLPFILRRRRRERRNQCPTCGYDRAGLAADAKCPECGADRAATSTTMPA